jgi:quercetin dioxygenase-like cupin family protein
MTPQKPDEIVGKTFTPAQLVEYQQGSIVSRMIVYKKAGTITLFAFDAGQGLSEHTAPYDAIITVLEGVGIFSIEGTESVVRKGEMIIIPANTPHAVEGKVHFKMMLTMIHGE